MERLDTQTIYEIFRACRLCGAGGGYKMPIIQNVIPLPFECTDDIELRQKIRDCTQMEIAHDDKMPPLICELCVDKVNDFYEFLEMVRGVNRRTRTRLGLPVAPVVTPQGGSDGDCILGVTEQVCPNQQVARGSGKPALKKESKTVAAVKEQKPKGIKNELQKLLKDVGTTVTSTRRGQSPTVTTTRTRNKEQPSVQEPNKSERTRSSATSKSLKRDAPEWSSDDDDQLSSPRAKRSRDIVRTGTVESGRKVKITIKLPTQPESPTKSKPGPKSSKLDLHPVQAEPRPGPKSSKTDSKPGPKSSKTDPKNDSKPGPRSSKTDSKADSKPGPKSSKIDPKPGPKSSKLDSRPSPKSLKNEPKPGPKSSKLDLQSSQKSSNLDFKPGPRSAKIKQETPGSKSVTVKTEPPVNETPVSQTKIKVDRRIRCDICEHPAKNMQGLYAHLRSHTVGFTDPKQACDACGEWFPSVDEATDHHQWHKTGYRAYRCRRCHGAFKRNAAFLQHIESNRCVPWPEVPDVRCPACANTFATRTLLAQHQCAKQADVTLESCSNCKKTFSTLKTLKKHEAMCLSAKKKHNTDNMPLATSARKKRDVDDISLSAVAKKKREEAVKIPPSIRKRLLPIQVRLASCDRIVKKAKNKINIARVSQDFGYDKRCVYPYRKFRAVKVKTEPWTSDNMVTLPQINEFYKEEDYVHWDSDLSSDEDEFESYPKQKRVDSLAVLALKTLFSKRCLGKVPRKLRKLKPDKTFDSLFNTNDIGDDFSLNINSLIDNLDRDDNDKDVKNDNVKDDNVKDDNVKDDNVKDCNSDSLIDKDDKNRTTNDDFDSIFNSNSKEIRNVENESKTANDKGDETDASLDDNYVEKRHEKSAQEKSNLDGFDIDNIDNVMTSLNGDKTDNVNGSKFKMDGDSLLKDIDAQIGESETRIQEKLPGGVSEKDGVILEDFKNDPKPYLDRISNEEFNFDA